MSTEKRDEGFEETRSNDKIEERMEANKKEDIKEVSRDRLIARIQCFEDELREWYHQLQEPERGVSEAEDELSKGVRIGAMNTISDVLDSYEDLFGDLTVCKYDGKGY